MEHNEYRMMFCMEQSYWWFLGKQHLVREQLNALFCSVSEPKKILDIGSGTGIVLRVLDEFGEAYGTDVSLEAIRFLKSRDLNRVVCADADRPLPFKDHSFALITCLDVLEHLEHDSPLLKEMLRACHKGGHVLITVPAFMFLWSPHDVALHHKRRYTLKQMRQLLEPLGCRILVASYFNSLLSIPILITRKLKGLFSKNDHARSDFFLNLPSLLNRMFAFLFKLEISLLRVLRFPFGVSILVVLENSTNHAAEAKPK